MGNIQNRVKNVSENDIRQSLIRCVSSVSSIHESSYSTRYKKPYCLKQLRYILSALNGTLSITKLNLIQSELIPELLEKMSSINQSDGCTDKVNKSVRLLSESSRLIYDRTELLKYLSKQKREKERKSEKDKKRDSEISDLKKEISELKKMASLHNETIQRDSSMYMQPPPSAPPLIK